ncbi:MAG: hypothetical protein ACR2QU_03245 [Gammaproteobacteria bacterium]
MSKQYLRITHASSGHIIAEGPTGWGITPFEGNYYISAKYLSTEGFRVNWIPGFCPYKFLYFWLDYRTVDGTVLHNLGWKYWFPNPLLPFIWFRVAVPAHHPALSFETYRKGAS